MQVIAEGMSVLRQMYPGAPDPVQSAFTRWAAEPFSRGAYRCLLCCAVLCGAVLCCAVLCGEGGSRHNRPVCCSTECRGLQHSRRRKATPSTLCYRQQHSLHPSTHSYFAVGNTKTITRTLAEPHGRVLFAGEATSEKPATGEASP